MACLGDGQVPVFEAALGAFRSAPAIRRRRATAAVAPEARRLRLPWYRLKMPGRSSRSAGSHRRHLLAHQRADRAISRLIAQDKQLTNRLLRAAGCRCWRWRGE